MALHHIHPVVCLTTGPQPPPMPFPQTVQSNASYFSFQYPLLPSGHPVAAYILFLIFLLLVFLQ